MLLILLDFVCQYEHLFSIRSFLRVTEKAFPNGFLSCSLLPHRPYLPSLMCFYVYRQSTPAMCSCTAAGFPSLSIVVCSMCCACENKPSHESVSVGCAVWWYGCASMGLGVVLCRHCVLCGVRVQGVCVVHPNTCLNMWSPNAQTSAHVASSKARVSFLHLCFSPSLCLSVPRSSIISLRLSSYLCLGQHAHRHLAYTQLCTCLHSKSSILHDPQHGCCCVFFDFLCFFLFLVPCCSLSGSGSREKEGR